MPHAKKSKTEMRQRALQYLGANRLMSLGTSTKQGRPWGATVFYAFDPDGTILFYSREDTLHCRNIRANPRVSVVINHAWRNKDGTIKGLQIAGQAKKVSPKDHARLYALYRRRFAWADEFKKDHTLYQINPREIWLIDQKFFGHFRRVRVAIKSSTFMH